MKSINLDALKCSWNEKVSPDDSLRRGLRISRRFPGDGPLLRHQIDLHQRFFHLSNLVSILSVCNDSVQCLKSFHEESIAEWISIDHPHGNRLGCSSRIDWLMSIFYPSLLYSGAVRLVTQTELVTKPVVCASLVDVTGACRRKRGISESADILPLAPTPVHR